MFACSAPRDERTPEEPARPVVSVNTRTNPDEIFGWMGMFNPALVAHLENDNQLAKLCPPQGDSAAVAQCRLEKLAPESLTVRLWSEPATTSQSVGSLLMIATPGKGLSAFFLAADGTPAVRVEPDLYDADWGYGPPYFHLSIAEDRRPWVRLPQDPLPPNTWVNVDDISMELITEWLAVGNIVKSPFGDLYIKSIDSSGVVARAEQPADMWCGSGAAPPPALSPDILVPRDSLFTPTGHLRVHVKYTRGC
jgi:hypothetical protein